jgi:hypothetical protein
MLGVVILMEVKIIGRRKRRKGGRGRRKGRKRRRRRRGKNKSLVCRPL